ncbi:MAG: hypothetical protein DA328_05180 [Nitrososphaeraceae archaeon]|nr:hypothetical protein [Nitrososphaeraceae archaeon]
MSINKMNITYELNPPKFLHDRYCFDYSKLNNEIQVLENRVLLLNDIVDKIHLTDSVLGIPRLSSINIAKIIEGKLKQILISCSIRTRDRNTISLYQMIADSIIAKIDSLLLIWGDKPKMGTEIAGVKPTDLLKDLNQMNFNRYIKFNLSIPSKITGINKILEKKIDAGPNAFVTQSIESISDFGNIVDIVRPYKIKVIACIMLPSEKNKKSADMIGLSWNEYEKDPVDFILQIGKMAEEIILSSPNDFSYGIEILNGLKKYR